MILSDRDIKKAIRSDRLVIRPYDDRHVQPVSVDLTLGKKMRRFRHDIHPVIDVKLEMSDLTVVYEMDDVAPFWLNPSEFVLGITAEWLELPSDLMGRLDGKSSLGRLGLLVHSTAGFIDPGFKGGIVLEFSNVSPFPISLYAGMPIAQISFYELSSPAARPYGHKDRDSKYLNQDEPTPSKYYLNFEAKRARSTARPREYKYDSKALQAWLNQSEFDGSVSLFADALGVKAKTVEDWVYGRNRPNPVHVAKLFELTGLVEFARVQQTLLSDDDGAHGGR